MSYSDYIAELLVNSGCYVHAPNNESLINVPTGDQILAYLSCRSLISNVKEREIIEEFLTEMVKRYFPSDITIAGIATAGITWAHAIASSLKLPMLYTRNSDKGYGLGGLVEGNINAAFNKAILIDDVLYTGSSVESARQALEQNNIQTIGIICVASLNDKVSEHFRRQGIIVIELTNYQNLLVAAEKKEILNQEEVVLMKKFYERR